MKKIRIVVAAVIAALSMSAIVAGFAAAHASSAPPLPKGTSAYYTYNKGYGVVVATAGINVSKTASFTITAPPYLGATFSPIVRVPGKPADNTSAFSNYLQQIGEWVYGPGKAWVPSGYPHVPPPSNLSGLTLVWKGHNAYTNGVETYVYEGKGLNRGDAFTVRRLLATGTFLH